VDYVTLAKAFEDIPYNDIGSAMWRPDFVLPETKKFWEEFSTFLDDSVRNDTEKTIGFNPDSLEKVHKASKDPHGFELYVKKLASMLPSNADELVAATRKKKNGPQRNPRIPKEPEAPPNATMGQWAWPDERPTQNLPDEPDTETEVRLHQALEGYFKRNWQIPQKYINVMHKMIERGWYSDVISYEQGGTVFRGVSLPVDTAENLGMKVREEPFGVISAHGMTLTPRGWPKFATSSWSRDYFIAKGFATESEKNPIQAVLVANVDDNPNSFIRCTNGLYDVQPFNAFNQEGEVLGTGPIKLNGAVWRLNSAGWPNVELVNSYFPIFND
jgi:hypothetical protein